MSIKPGTYKAKIADYGVVLSQKGQPQVKVVFSLETGTKFSWFGGISSEQQTAITTKTLFTMGATSDTIDKVENGPSGNALNTAKTYELVIEDNEYNGKVSQRIKYINDPENAQKQAFSKPNGSLSALKGMAASLIARGEIADKKTSTDAGF